MAQAFRDCGPTQLSRFDDTIVAISSGRPPAAIAVVRISGRQARDAAVAVAGELPPPRQATLRTLRDPGNGRILDRALVLTFPAPRSVTGEDVVEFHVHGGRAVAAAVERTLTAQSGCRAAEAGEFTRRAFENGRIDLVEAEGLADLLAAETEDQRRRAIEATEGHVSRRIEDWANRILALSARAEALLDFSDEDNVAGDERVIRRETVLIAEEMAAVLAEPPVEALHDGPLIALAGPPNVGKSTLLNALVGRDAAIVSPIAGTTRDRIDVTVMRSGRVYRLVDTAGLRDAAADLVEAEGIERARRSLDSADVILWLGDDCPPEQKATVLWLQPRADMPGRKVEQQGRVALSATTGVGISELWQRIESISTALLPAQDTLALNKRQRECLDQAHEALDVADQSDLLMIAEHLRVALRAIDRLLGRTGVENMLDALFSQFCMGK